MNMKIITRNRKAFHDYEVLEKIEAGIALSGTEVKSVRAGKINLQDSYATYSNDRIVMHQCHISPYTQGNIYNHDPYRKRVLLLHNREINHLRAEVERKNLTLIPLEVYFKRQWVKIQLGLCRGRKKYDKRQHIAKQESKKRLNRMMRAAR